MTRPASGAVCFGPFRLDPAAYRLVRGDRPVPLSPRAFDVLQFFATRPGALLTKTAILDAVWRDVAVTPNALTQVVSELREALGDPAASPRYIETVPRRGYRFVAAVEPAEAGVAPTSAPPEVSPPAGAAGRTIAVLDFANITGDPDVAWLSTGMAESLTNGLRALEGVTVIDRAFTSGLGASAAGQSGGGPAVTEGVDLVVTGSVQRAGDRLRVGARVIQTASGAVVGQARADGTLDGIFALQDDILAQLSAGLEGPGRAPSAVRSRETSSLEAYRALTEARLRLERLDPVELDAAVAGFERALALDPAYALAYVGLAHARFWRFQHTRAGLRPDRAALADAVAHARRAIALDGASAEAHAALGFFLASAGEYDAAAEAGRRAVQLEPGSWRHLFRLGMATWGSERLAALHATIARFPELAYAHFGAAMVHVARQDLDRAGAGLSMAAARPARSPELASRFPAAGLHWLLGLVRLAREDLPGAREAFDAELAEPRGPMLAAEYEGEAWTGHGFVRLAAHDPAGAAAMFERTLERFPGHVRALVGLAETWTARGSAGQARRAIGRAEAALADLRAGGRTADAALGTACVQASTSDLAGAIRTLVLLLDDGSRSPVGWSIPIEPLLAPLRREPAFQDVLARLRDRAR
jgi:DNA-binding winged helix-turn-helix (wHTH) protein/tetratricopeptide (TPR) repeat protein